MVMNCDLETLITNLLSASHLAASVKASWIVSYQSGLSQAK